jgi:NAD(P) transhydrogenase
MPHQYDYDLLCIGSGPAGQRAAVQAAKLGKRVAVVERRRSLGGVCIDTGTIPSKTLREAVLVAGTNKPRFHLGAGVASESRPTIEQLLARVNSVIGRESEVVEHQLRRNDITLISGDASFLDEHRLQVDSGRGPRVATAEYILIAVGTIPTEPPGVQTDGTTVIVSDGLLDLKGLARSMAVVGA